MTTENIENYVLDLRFDDDYEMELNFACGNYIPIPQCTFTNYSINSLKHKTN